MTERRKFLKYSKYLANCTSEISLYGSCVSTKSDKISKGDCTKEFEALFRCVQKQITTLKK